MDILYIGLIFLAGYFFGWFRASKTMLDRMLSKPESMIELLEKYKTAKQEDEVKVDDDVREIEVHNEKGAFYLYAKDNGEFLGQGTTLDQALAVVKERFPGKNFAGHIPNEKAKQMGLIN
jgi:uncharacterized protein YneF (UPF0154 family)